MSYLNFTKTVCSFLIVISSIFSQAQVTRFIYEYKYVPDSLNQNDIKTELMYLDVSKEKSEFFSADKFKVDSAMYSDKLKNVFNMPPSKSFISYRITKHLNENAIIHLPLISEKFAITFNPKFDWKLSDECIFILDKKSQKATTTFGGREWNAYFSKDFPLNDGPYKFKGLPGLITKIEDVKHQHIFKLVGVTILPNNDFEEKLFKKSSDGEISITAKEYSKILKNYRKDPVAHLVGQIPDQTDSSGNFRSSTEILKTIKGYEMKKIQQNNNTLELDEIRN